MQGTPQERPLRFCDSMEHNAKALVDWLNEFGAKPSPPGMEWAQSNWWNIQPIADRIAALWAGAKVKKGKGKPVVCASK